MYDIHMSQSMHPWFNLHKYTYDYIQKLTYELNKKYPYKPSQTTHLYMRKCPRTLMNHDDDDTWT